MTVDARTWTLTGEHERATHTFSEDGRTQEVVWEWKPETLGCRCATGPRSGSVD